MAAIKEIEKAVKCLKGVSEEQKQSLLRVLQQNRTLHLMACGMSGTGKSTLLNGICGQKLFEVGDSGEDAHVIQKVVEEGTSKLILTEVSGFEGDPNEEKHFETIKEKCTNVDILMYCVNVSAGKIKLENDVSTLTKLKLVLDEKVCSNSVIALTFANTIVDKIEDEQRKVTPEEIKVTFDERIERWRRKVLQAFSDAGIENSNVAIVYTGTSTKLRLLGKVDQLPWLSTLWNALCATLHEDPKHEEYYQNLKDKKLALVYLNLKRIRSKIISSSKNDPLHRQPLIMNLEPSFLAKKFPTIAAALAVGGTSGVAGAGIGALIGALAIGIPSFGIAAGAGLAIGGAVGGAVGVAAGVATHKAAEKLSESQK